MSEKKILLIKLQEGGGEVTVHIVDCSFAQYVKWSYMDNVTSISQTDWSVTFPANKTWKEIIDEELFSWDMRVGDDGVVYATDMNGSYYYFPAKEQGEGKEAFSVKGSDYPSSELIYGLGTCGVA